MASMSPHQNMSDDDQWTLFCIIAVVLILLVVVFDTAAHGITHTLHHEVHEHKHVVMSEYRDKMYFLLWASLQSELMVLGFLAFTIWLCKQVGILDIISHAFEKEASRELGDTVQSAHMPFWHVPCARAGPHEPEEFLELVEHAHMAFFISMVLYFLFLAVALSRLLRTLHLYEVREFEASHGQSPSRASERRTLEQVAGSREYLLRRVQIMFEEELASRPAVKATMEQGILDYTAFLEVTTRRNIECRVEFPMSTWLLVCLYFGAFAAGGQLLCFSMEFSFSIIIDGCYAWSTLYMAVRLLVFRRRVTRGSLSASAWPCHVLDRILFIVVGPGVAGFYPWSAEPSEVAALCCTQAMLFFQMVWMAYMIVPNPLTHRMMRMTNLPGGLWVQIFVRVICVALWALFILPLLLEVFAMPPFITDEEVEDLFKVLEANPTGSIGDHVLADNPNRRHSISLVVMRRVTRLRRSVAPGSSVHQPLVDRLGHQ